MLTNVHADKQTDMVKTVSLVEDKYHIGAEHEL